MRRALRHSTVASGMASIVITEEYIRASSIALDNEACFLDQTKRGPRPILPARWLGLYTWQEWHEQQCVQFPFLSSTTESLNFVWLRPASYFALRCLRLAASASV